MEIEERKYVAKLFDPTRDWSVPIRALAEAYPHWIDIPTTVEQREQMLWGLVTSPNHLAWEVWKEQEWVGIILLTDVSPLVGARLHIAFVDRNLVSKTRLIRRFLRYCFTELHFQRMTVHVPVFVWTLSNYFRKKHGFKFEGEGLVDREILARIGPQTDPLNPRKMIGPAPWIASVGSRNERAHWDPKTQTWADVYRLRLLASEFDDS